MAQSQNTTTTTADDSDSSGSNAKRGFPGKLTAARSSAPDDTSDKAIQSVAWVATEFELDRHGIADLWEFVAEQTTDSEEEPEPHEDSDITEWGER